MKKKPIKNTVQGVTRSNRANVANVTFKENVELKFSAPFVFILPAIDTLPGESSWNLTDFLLKFSSNLAVKVFHFVSFPIATANFSGSTFVTSSMSAC